MPFKYLAEMICDRVAASMIYLGDKYTDAAPLDYYLSHMDENQFDEATRTTLEIALVRIKMDGLETVLEDIREALRS